MSTAYMGRLSIYANRVIVFRERVTFTYSIDRDSKLKGPAAPSARPRCRICTHVFPRSGPPTGLGICGAHSTRAPHGTTQVHERAAIHPRRRRAPRSQPRQSHTRIHTKYMRHAGLQRSTLLQDDSAIETGGQLTHIHMHIHTHTAQTQNTTRLHKT